jgi:hypothetical protein
MVLWVFVRVTTPRRPKGWGIVFDIETNIPLSRSIVRLFDAQFNKLIATEISDRRGRYAFLAGESQFYLTCEHIGYETKKTDIIDLSGLELGTIARDIGLKKVSGTESLTHNNNAENQQNSGENSGPNTIVTNRIDDK